MSAERQPSVDAVAGGAAALLRVPTVGLRCGSHQLSAEASRYVLRVHRKQAGDLLELFDPEQGTEAQAVVGQLLGQQLQCEVRSLQAGSRPGISGLHLVQGLSKGDKSEQVVRDAVALGAASVSFVECAHSVARRSPRDADKHERMVRVAVEAARQCGRSDIPALHQACDWNAVYARWDGALNLVLHPNIQALSLEAALHPAPIARPVVIYVGPEGGFAEKEVAALVQRGARLVSLGSLVLRTELAAVAALARAAGLLSR